MGSTNVISLRRQKLWIDCLNIHDGDLDRIRANSIGNRDTIVQQIAETETIFGLGRRPALATTQSDDWWRSKSFHQVLGSNGISKVEG